MSSAVAVALSATPIASTKSPYDIWLELLQLDAACRGTTQVKALSYIPQEVLRWWWEKGCAPTVEGCSK